MRLDMKLTLNKTTQSRMNIICSAFVLYKAEIECTLHVNFRLLGASVATRVPMLSSDIRILSERLSIFRWTRKRRERERDRNMKLKISSVGADWSWKELKCAARKPTAETGTTFITEIHAYSIFVKLQDFRRGLVQRSGVSWGGSSREGS
jgi:hypothetical protein